MPNTFTPRVITGESVDIISPFPPVYLERLVKWMYQYRSLLTHDDGPQTAEEMAVALSSTIDSQVTYGVVDKHNMIGVNTTGPIVVGAYILDVSMPKNVHIHTVSQRRAWGKGLMDEGLDLVLDDIFQDPAVLRVTANMLANNRAVVNFAERHGFKREGRIRDAILVKSEPKSILMYGMTRPDYDELRQLSKE